MLDTKKLMAPRRVSPFLQSNFCVSALKPNSSYKGKIKIIINQNIISFKGEKFSLISY